MASSHQDGKIRRKFCSCWVWLLRAGQPDLRRVSRGKSWRWRLEPSSHSDTWGPESGPRVQQGPLGSTLGASRFLEHLPQSSNSCWGQEPRESSRPAVSPSPPCTISALVHLALCLAICIYLGVSICIPDPALTLTVCQLWVFFHP